MKKILTIQDISCVGQCSLTVAMPIISAMGIETCILPSAILSTHTYNFKNYTFRDLTEDLPNIKNHWKSENISFAISASRITLSADCVFSTALSKFAIVCSNRF